MLDRDTAPRKRPSTRLSGKIPFYDALGDSEMEKGVYNVDSFLVCCILTFLWNNVMPKDTKENECQ